NKLFIVETIDGALKYSCKNVDTVEIKNPYAGFISYGKSSGWDIIFDVVNYTDIHYIAFSADKKIDELKEADVTYTTQSYHYTGKNDEGFSYGEKSVPQYITLTGKEEFDAFGSKKYSWKSIYRTKEFIETTNLKDEAKKEVEKSEFVLVFLKTPFKEVEKWSMMQGHYKECDGVKVSDVSILRLKFETDGISYNLGAVMDKIDGDLIPDNEPEFESLGFWKYVWNCVVKLFKGEASFVETLVAIVALLVVLVLFPVLIGILSIVFPAFRQVIKSIFNGIWWLICLPFRGLKALFNKIRGE
ncbi:MAG: hypothetical protein NC311_15075, partial [Muribaculaceae bacterium]|nr:hypothetical protein [Muribaculaceae bacterium]